MGLRHGPPIGLGEGLVEKLKSAGIPTVEALADMTPEQLEAIEGIGPKTVEKISVAVNNYFASLEGGETVALPENEGEEAVAGSEPGEPEVTPAETSAEAEGAEEHVAPQGEVEQAEEEDASEATEPAEQKE